MHRNSAIAAAAVLALFGGSALASGERVAIDRAQLDDPAYVASLHAEIEQAAIKECKADLAGSVFYRYQIEDCIAGTVAAAVDEIGSEALSSYSASGERDYPIAG